MIGPFKDGGGLIGRVVQVAGSASTVRLITDPASGVTAGILGGSAKGILLPSDAGDGLLSMENVKQEDVVNQGDTVITSGYDVKGYTSLFPRGIPGRQGVQRQPDRRRRPDQGDPGDAVRRPR